jgi:hypothetical protein
MAAQIPKEGITMSSRKSSRKRIVQVPGLLGLALWVGNAEYLQLQEFLDV